jgi:hypothetical protein
VILGHGWWLVDVFGCNTAHNAIPVFRRVAKTAEIRHPELLWRTVQDSLPGRLSVVFQHHKAAEIQDGIWISHGDERLSGLSQFGGLRARPVPSAA